MHSFALASVRRDGGSVPALVQNDRYVLLSELGRFGIMGAGNMIDVLEHWDANLPALEKAAAAMSDGSLTSARALDGAALAAPVTPRQIFCTGANYRKHVIGLIMGDPSMRGPEDKAMSDEERLANAEKAMDQRAKSALPYSFIKLPSCVVGPQDEVILPRNVVKPDWELELGIVIGKRARHVAPEDALDYIAGYVIANDVTAREHIFRRDGSAIGADWLSGKCFPTFLPLGPLIVPRQFVPDPYDLNIRLSVNGRVYQDETTADMMIGIDRQLSYLSDRVELMPGDIICTGSPYGNGSAFGVHLQPGDVMEGSITGLGTQRNLCVAEG